MFLWLWAQGPSLQEKNPCPKSSWESFAFVDDEEDEERDKVSQQFALFFIPDYICLLKRCIIMFQTIIVACVLTILPA